MDTGTIDSILLGISMSELFPADTTDRFFEALYADTEEGAFDIELKYKGVNEGQLRFEFRLTQRPGKCLGCSLTYGLPGVFSRHPVIDLEGLVRRIEEKLEGVAKCRDWLLGRTVPVSKDLHVIPLSVNLA